MKRIFIFILIFFFVKSITAQVKLADVLFDNFEYELAAKYYSESDSLNIKQQINHALCFYNKNNFHKAIPLFEKAMEKDTNNLFLKFHYGVSLKSVGRYQSSKRILRKIYEKDSSNLYLKLHLSSLDSLMKWDTIQFFKKLAAFDQLNSKASEFSPSFYDDGIFYIIEKGSEEIHKGKRISLIANNDTISPKEKGTFTNQFDSVLTYGPAVSPRTYVYKNDIEISELFKDYANPIPKEAIDTAKLIISHKGFNVTSYSTNYDGKKVFYTRHPVNNKWSPETTNNPLMFQGQHHSKKPKLKKRRILAIKYLPKTFGSGDVSVTSDGETVYFSSDKRNGFGGTDLYVSHKKITGKWSKAKNLGNLINTPFNEESPRIYDDSVLYFSSNGWPGYGKADIFKCKIHDDSVFNIQHLPYPVNSSGDDIHFALHPFDESIGILNSDRSRGQGDEDIYFAHMIPIGPYVKGYVRLKADSSIQKNCIVTLFDLENHELKQVTTKVNGIYRFELKVNQSYKVCATRTGLSGCISVNADDELFRNEKRDIFLDSITAIQDYAQVEKKRKAFNSKTLQGYIIDEDESKVSKAKIEFFDQKDSLVAKIYSRDDGFFRLAVDHGDNYYIMATKEKKAGVAKVKITENYQTDSITNIRIYNNRAIIYGIVYDTNGLPSNSAVVRLLDSNDVEVERITTKEDGQYQLSMTTFRHYRIIVTNYEMTKDTSFYVNSDWGAEKRKDFYLLKNPTVQGYTYFKDSVKILDDVMVSVESGYDSKYISIYSDKNGFFQFPLFNDSLLYMDGIKRKMKGTTTVDMDSTHQSIEIHNIYLHPTTTDAHGIVIYSNDSVVSEINVQLIDKDGKIVSETKTDSLGRFYFELRTDTDYELYTTEDDLEAIENIHTGIFWNKKKNIILKLSQKGTPTFGLVIDSEEKTPLGFVKITLTDSITNLKNITYSNKQGMFEMSLKKNTTSYIKLEKDNYFTKTIVVKIQDTVPKIIDLSKGYNLDLTKSNFKIDPIYFEFDSHQITPNSKIELDKLALWLKSHKERSCSIYGYTDCRGKQNYNLSLSRNRAQTVSLYLSKKGVNSKRTNIIPRGATNYVNNCYSSIECTEAEHRENRRCEFEIND